LVSDSIERLEINVTPALNVIRAFVEESKAEHGNILRMECLSFDAVDPYQSRLKAYLRTPQTSLQRVQEIYTLGGRLRGPEIDVCIVNLRRFWSGVLGVNDEEEEELMRSTHRTAVIPRSESLLSWTRMAPTGGLVCQQCATSFVSSLEGLEALWST
jgi:DMATS type aromatic prenyltransferase